MQAGFKPFYFWPHSPNFQNNAAELMHVYISHGYLEDAARLACEYISAVLGTGKVSRIWAISH